MFLLGMKLRFRFSIASFLMTVTVAVVVLAWRYDREQLVSQIELLERQRHAFAVLSRRASVQLDDRGKPISVHFAKDCEDQDLLLVKELPTVREVNLAYCHLISDRAVECLLQLPDLEVLYLYRNNPNWVDQFKEGFDMTNQPRITDKSLNSIAKIQSLKELYLYDNQFSDEGIIQLCTLSNLKKLEFRSERISEATVARLRKAMPTTEIRAE